jgi:sugar phosphate isomerase/epimerase
MKVGIGTYSFGGMASYLGLGPSLEEKFKTIKSLGYDSVELLPVDLDGNTAEDIKKWLAENGLTVTSVHAEPTEDMVKKLAAVGGHTIIWAGTPFCNKAEAIEVAQLLDEMADMAAPYGVKVGYHNHSHEFYFDEGKCLLIHLLDNSKKCFSQLDCGWAMNGGMYPPNFIRKYKNRIISIHVKENNKVNGPGGPPQSRHAEKDKRFDFFANAKDMPLEERQKILDRMTEMAKSMPGMNIQCKMGAPDSNIDWKEIKKALDEQDFAADWIVEREGFYGDHDQCIAEDCAWIKENIQ